MAGKRPPEGRAHIREAIRRLRARGKKIGVRDVRGELLRWRAVGASMRDIVGELAAYRREVLELASGRIEQAVEAILALGDDIERDAVQHAVNTRAGGNLRMKFTSRGRSTWPQRRARQNKPTPHGVAG